MEIGISLPLMEPGLGRDQLRQWLDNLEAGPFSSVALGERIAFHNPELLTTLGACALYTQRLRIITTVVVATLHHPVLLAKQLASIDQLCNGRLEVGLGIGGREEDYRALDVSLDRKKNIELARQVERIQAVWRGEHVVPGAANKVGPMPTRAGGPSLLAGAMGPKALQRAAHWADGITGFSFGPDIAEIRQHFDLAREAWQAAGREQPPRLITSFWYALEESGGREQLNRHLRRYLSWLDPALVEQMLPGTGFCGSAAELRALIAQLRDAGADEVLLTPVNSHPDEVLRVSDALG